MKTRLLLPVALAATAFAMPLGLSSSAGAFAFPASTSTLSFAWAPAASPPAATAAGGTLGFVSGGAGGFTLPSPGTGLDFAGGAAPATSSPNSAGTGSTADTGTGATTGAAGTGAGGNPSTGAAPTGAAGGSGSVAATGAGLSAQAQILFNDVNRYRTSHGLAALVNDPVLDAIAVRKVEDMLKYHYFSHVSPDFGTTLQLEEKMGLVRFDMGAENIAEAGSVTEAFWMFIGSPPHLANIMNPGLTRTGVGVINGPYGVIVAQEFTGN